MVAGKSETLDGLVVGGASPDVPGIAVFVGVGTVVVSPLEGVVVSAPQEQSTTSRSVNNNSTYLLDKRLCIGSVLISYGFGYIKAYLQNIGPSTGFTCGMCCLHQAKDALSERFVVFAA